MGDIEQLVHLPNSAVFNVKADKAQRLGQLGITPDCRVFKYGLSGATDISAARLCQTEAPATTSDELAVAAARAIGDRTVTVTVDLVDGDLKEGYMNVEDDAGEGHLYSIEANTDDGTTTTVTLEGGHGLIVALTTSTTVGLWQNPMKDVIVHPSPATAMLVGVSPRAITAARYAWWCVSGLISGLTEGTVVINEEVIDSATADGAMAPTAALVPAEYTVGIVHEVAATTEESTIHMKMI
jgi:hypothetical protein